MVQSIAATGKQQMLSRNIYSQLNRQMLKNEAWNPLICLLPHFIHAGCVFVLSTLIYIITAQCIPTWYVQNISIHNGWQSGYYKIQHKSCKFKDWYFG